MSENPQTTGEVLGLDLGTNSLGWALIKPDGGIRASGVRVFEAGAEGDIASGRDQSRAVNRRLMRLQRRQLWRRTWRLKKLFVLLQEAGLLPDSNGNEAEARDAVLKTLDLHLVPKHRQSGRERQANHLLPYLLRAKALTDKLEPFELGRALYHLGQRRGFESNRRSVEKDDKEAGKVKADIGVLEKEMLEAGAPTLGAYLSTLDPDQQRVRRRWTARSMFKDEFAKIWAAQAPHHAGVMTEDMHKKLFRVLFYRRPLKSQKRLVGPCELVHRRRRASKASLLYQRFRLLQAVNHLEGYDNDGFVVELTDEQRGKLAAALNQNGDLTFSQIRTLLDFRRSQGIAFNLERGGEKRLPGNRTTARLAPIFGERWESMSLEERQAVVHDVLSYRKKEALGKRGREFWKLSPEKAQELAAVRLEDGYGSLSTKALGKLIPLLEKGLTFMEAVDQAFPERRIAKPVCAVLPAARKALSSLRNPTVERAMSELRKVVNGLVRKYGKPGVIRIELARDLKRPRKERETWSKKNRKQQDWREKAAEKLLNDARIRQPKRSDIEKALLFLECDGVCPYTGKQIGFAGLFGDSPQFDVEHIIPFPVSLDDSFLNKTLCYNQENREVKGKRTPWEAYSGVPDRFEQILARVKAFRSDAVEEKLRRFSMQPEQVQERFASFSNRHLQDSRYAARLASEYLGLLYGGKIDADGTLRVQVTAGQVTAFLRDEWHLNGILGDGPGKSRDDHRHHALDAIVVALAGPGVVQTLRDAAARAVASGRRRFAPIPEPWSEFKAEAYKTVHDLVVSHRVDRKLGGAMHKDTLYSPPIQARDARGRPVEVRHLRRELSKLKASEVSKIVDKRVREAVERKLSELGAPPERAFVERANHPSLEAKDGRRVAIHKVRIRVSDHPARIGSRPRERHVVNEGNHHIEVLEKRDRQGIVTWDRVLVDRLEAHRRLRAKLPVIQRNHGAAGKFLFSLAPGELIEVDDGQGGRMFCRVRSVNKDPRVGYVLSTDARLKGDISAAGDLFRHSIDQLRAIRLRKVVVDPLGGVRPAYD